MSPLRIDYNGKSLDGVLGIWTHDPFNVVPSFLLNSRGYCFQKLLDLATDVKGVIRKQDSRYIISGVANNKVGRDLAWNWLRGNWAHIYNFYKSGSVSSAGSLIATCASTFNNDFELQELEEFYRDKLNELGSGKRSAESAIQKTKANVKWMREHYEEITGWLEKKNEFARNRVWSGAIFKLNTYCLKILSQTVWPERAIFESSWL